MHILGVRVPRLLPDFSNSIGMPETVKLLPIMPIGPPGATVLQSGVHLCPSIALFPKIIWTMWTHLGLFALIPESSHDIILRDCTGQVTPHTKDHCSMTCCTSAFVRE